MLFCSDRPKHLFSFAQGLPTIFFYTNSIGSSVNFVHYVFGSVAELKFFGFFNQDNWQYYMFYQVN